MAQQLRSKLSWLAEAARMYLPAFLCYVVFGFFIFACGATQSLTLGLVFWLSFHGGIALVIGVIFLADVVDWYMRKPGRRGIMTPPPSPHRDKQE